MVGHDDFFNKLLGETYLLVEHDSEVKNNGSLADYFENKSNNNKNISSHRLFYIPELNVFRAKLSEDWIDFPANWGPFIALKEKVQFQNSFTFVIESNDPSKLGIVLFNTDKSNIVINCNKNKMSFYSTTMENINQAA